MINIKDLFTKPDFVLPDIESAAMIEVQKAIVVLLNNSLITKGDIIQLRDYLTSYSETVIDMYNREH